MKTYSSLNQSNNDLSPKPPRRRSEDRTVRCAPTPSLSRDEEEWNIRRHHSTLSLRQLTLASTPMRGSSTSANLRLEDKRSNTKVRRSRRRDTTPEIPAFTRQRSEGNTRYTLGGSLASARSSVERKVIRSSNSNYSWTKRATKDERSNMQASASRSNYSWSQNKPMQSLSSCTDRPVESRAIPNSILIVSDFEAAGSCAQTRSGMNRNMNTPTSYGDVGTNDDVDNSYSESVADDFDINMALSALEPLTWNSDGSCSISKVAHTKNIDDSLSTFVGPTPVKQVYKTSSMGFSKPLTGETRFDVEVSKQRLHESKRTTSTMESTSYSSDGRDLQVTYVQLKPWNCLCGEENDHDFNFCGMCAKPEKWTCTSCQFARNKCRQLHCGGCGASRMPREGTNMSRPQMHGEQYCR
jgi:hypothetical protein